MPKSLDKSGWEKVVREQIMRGEPVKAIAASLGCSNTSVVNFMRASGIAAPASPAPLPASS